MQAKELKTMTIVDLEQEKEALLRQAFNLRMQRGVGQTPKTDQFKKVRRTIARINTFLNQKKKDNSGTEA